MLERTDLVSRCLPAPVVLLYAPSGYGKSHLSLLLAGSTVRP